MITSAEILKKYLVFLKQQGHTQIPGAPLVSQNDPTTLFTSSGMQPLVPYLLGEEHPAGKRLVDVQNCLRTQDIEEVGDNRHTTFFRMLGNWSLGDYFKEDQINWFWTYLTDKKTGLGLEPQKLYVTVFIGDPKNKIPQDTKAAEIWKKLFKKAGIDAREIEIGDQKTGAKLGMQNGRIFYYNATKNWWSRAGVPENMPAGEPGGPDTEVFFDFGTPHDSKYGKNCHPNCDCGRFLEIGNSVFMQYLKKPDGSFQELPQKNVDFGGGLERLAAAANNDQDIFKTDLYSEIIAQIEEVSGKKYTDEENKYPMRVLADHLKAATFLILSGVTPSNKEHGYILRRLLRRSAVKMHELSGRLTPSTDFQIICDRGVLRTEEKIDQSISKNAREKIFEILKDEMTKFGKSLDKGLKILKQTKTMDARLAFDLYQTYGFPLEITKELLAKKGETFDQKAFEEEFKKHQNLSRRQSAGKFKGGLADQKAKTIMGHTATHLLHQALRDVLGSHVHQTGSNITSERIRFDFNYEKKLTNEELEKVQNIVNEKIKENLPVHFEFIDTEKARKMGAIGLFMDTYGEKSKIYFIGPAEQDPTAKPYSIEFCGGPHVDFTGELKSFKIIKQENLGKNQKRLYALVSD